MKKKLNLDELQVKSFVANLNNEAENTVKGGSYHTGCGFCVTENILECPTNMDKCYPTAINDYKSSDRRCTYACEFPS